MKRLLFGLALLLPLLASAQDVDAWMKAEKARSEAPKCRALLAESKSTGTMPLSMMTYTELERTATALTHCGFVFRIVGDAASGDAAGDESDRYDAIAFGHVQKYLMARGLWEDFTKSDCRALSKTCGSKH